MPALQILVIDDEAAIRQVLAAQLEAEGHHVEHVGSGEAAIARLAKGDVDVAVCDIRLPDVNGIEVMRRALEAGADTVFIVMTAFASVSTAVEAMKSGAKDYLIKPVRAEDLTHRISQAAQMLALRRENLHLRELVPEAGKGQCELPSEASRRVMNLAERVARTEGTVLITGESGTGKSALANVIHRRSSRAAAPLIMVNCGAIPKELLESEFFGHLKGAFTGAERAKKGLMLSADEGTLLLDEIAELPLDLQVKLLHAIEDKEIRPVGGERSRRVDVRILAATNRNLERMVADGDFREDLYYRLNLLEIRLPSLRERPDDVKALIAHALREAPSRLGLPGVYGIDSECEALLCEYHWPGNIRELQNVISRALILTDSDTITLADLPDQLTRAPREQHAADAGNQSLRELTRQFEISAIEQAVTRADGDRKLAARHLGIGLSTLYRKLEEQPSLEPD